MKPKYLDMCLPTKECAICGKSFIAGPNYMYKLGNGKGKKYGKLNYFCSYTCYRKAGGDSGKFSKRERKNIEY